MAKYLSKHFSMHILSLKKIGERMAERMETFPSAIPFLSEVIRMLFNLFPYFGDFSVCLTRGTV